MGDRLTPKFGFLLFDPDLFAPETEAAQGSQTFQSNYSQAGPRPGRPTVPAGSDWRPEAQGAQSVALTSRVIQGGLTKRGGRGAAVLVRKASESTEADWVGWEEFNHLQTWTTPTDGYNASADWDRLTGAVLPGSRDLVILGMGLTGTSSAGKVWRYNPRDESWDDGFDFQAGGALFDDPPCLVLDPDSERLIAYFGEAPAGNTNIISLYSTDGGDTWALHGRAHFEVETHTGRVRVAASARRPWLMIRAGSNDLDQFSSIDRGVTWEKVGATNATQISGYQADCVALKGGGYLVVYHDNATGEVKCRKLATAGTVFADQEVVNVSTTRPAGTVVCAVDEDGIVYVASTMDAETKDLITYRRDQVVVWRSSDGGSSWEEYAWGALQDTSGTAYCELEQALCSGGQLHLLHTIAASSASLGASFGVFSMGGWSSVEHGVGETFLAHQRTQRFGYGAYRGVPTINGDAVTWIPFDTPDNMGWSSSGAGTAALLNGGYLRLTTTLAQSRFWTRQYAHVGSYTAGQCWVQVTSGGDASDDDIAILVRMSASASSDHRAAIRLTTSSITVYDVHGTTDLGAVTGLDLRSGVYLRWVQVFGALPKITVWFRFPGSRKWRNVVDGEQTTNLAAGGAGTDAVSWGHIAASAAQSEWRMFGTGPEGDYRWKLDSVSDTNQSATIDGYVGLLYGRQLPGRAAKGYPCPELTDADEDMGFLAASGTAVEAEEVGHPVGYTRPISRLYPHLSPRPTRYWESADTSEQRLVWELNRPQWLGGAFALVVVNAWPRQWVIEYDNGASGWTTAGTLDLALGTGLNCAISGTNLRPRSGTSGVGRYIHEGELRGGYVLASADTGGGAGSGTVARRIADNSGGYWENSSTVQAVQVRLEGVDGSEDPSGTCTLVAPSGYMVVYPTTHLTRQRWRIRIPSGQLTPTGTYRAGLAAPARVVAAGAQPGWRWRRTLRLQRSATLDRGGFPLYRELGSALEAVEYDWTDGLHFSFLRNVDNDYFGVSGGQPIASKEDVATALWGFLERSLRSGEVPAGLVYRFETSSGQTVTDPSLWQVGVLETDSVGLSGVNGEEGSNELARLDSARFLCHRGVIGD